MTPLQAKAAIVLFEAGRAQGGQRQAALVEPLFDTVDIADLIGTTEAEVTNLLAASREIVREMFDDLTLAANAP